MKIEKKAKIRQVHLMNDSDLYDLIQFANSVEYCINHDRNDLALEELERFRNNLKKRMKEGI